MNSQLHPSRYYRASGVVSVLGMVKMLGTGLLAGVVLAFIYSYLVFYNPLLIVNVLATAGFGGILGIVMVEAGKAGKLRSPLVTGLIGFLVAGFALYLHWVVYLHILAGQAEQNLWPWDPLTLIALMGSVAEQGVWSFSAYTPTGPVLFVIWGIEGLIVVGLTALITSSSAETNPFCESCEVWAVDKLEAKRRLGAIADLPGLTSRLEAGDLSALRELGPPAGLDASAIELKHCPSCQQSGWLTVEAITGKRDKNGKLEEKRSFVLTNLILDARCIHETVQLDAELAGAAEEAQPVD